MKAKYYRDVRVWQESMALVVDVYSVARRFPDQERAGLTALVHRAASSIPSRIAEAYVQYSWREWLRQLSLARGAVAEVETEILLAARLGYVMASEIGGVLTRAATVDRMLNELQQELCSRVATAKQTARAAAMA